MSENVVNFIPSVKLTMANNKPHETIENLKEILKAHQIKVKYNEMSKQMELAIPGKNYLLDNATNCGISELSSILHSYRMSSAHLKLFLFSVADENRYHPAQIWIESMPWDGISRLDKLYATITATNEPLKQILLYRWLISCVAAIYEVEGISASGMLVLSGKTNMGKTNWFKNLLPASHQFMSKDGMAIDPHKRDSLMPCLEHWLVELGEIDATFKKSDLAALKAFITARLDVLRLAYAPANSRFPRKTIFFGSVDKKEFLKDPAGNRRFWTIEATSIDHTHGLDMQQIWAELKVLYDNGEKWHLDPEEFEMLQESNKQYELIDPMEENLTKKYDFSLPNSLWKTASEILGDMGYIRPSRGEATACALLVRKLNGNVGKRSNGRNLLALPQSNF